MGAGEKAGTEAAFRWVDKVDKDGTRSAEGAEVGVAFFLGRGYGGAFAGGVSALEATVDPDFFFMAVARDLGGAGGAKLGFLGEGDESRLERA